MKNEKSSSRRVFIRRLVGVAAAGAAASSLSERLTGNPTIPPAQAQGTPLYIDQNNSGSGETFLHSGWGDGVLRITNDKAGGGAGFARGIYGLCQSDDGVGVEGVANLPTATGYTKGVRGQSWSGEGVGVEGYASNGGGPTRGVYGEAASTSGTGVMGKASAGSGTTYGVRGESASTDGTGVYGYASATTGGTGRSPIGVSGRVDASGGTWDTGPWPAGVVGYAAGQSGAGSGVYGRADSPDADGVTGEGFITGVWGEASSPDGAGVRGYASATSGATQGVRGQSDSTSGTGVEGYATALSGYTEGVMGQSQSPEGVGVKGHAAATTSSLGLNPRGVLGIVDAVGGTWQDGPWPQGVAGVANATSGACIGVYGECRSPVGLGVNGGAVSAAGWASGVEGDTASEEGGCGVVGWAYATSGYNAGVWGGSRAPGGAGVQGDADADGGIGVLGHARNSPAAVPIVAWAASGQTAPLQQWVRSDWTPLAVVDANGQFGIGTASPLSHLYVVDSTTSPSRGAVAAQHNDGRQAALMQMKRSRGSESSPAALVDGDYAGAFNFNTYDGANYLVTAGFGAFIKGTVAAGSVPTDLFFYTAAGGTLDPYPGLVRLVVSSNGNVGVGTTGPTERLHVAGNVKAAGFITGDITYANGMKTTEEGDGLAFLNAKGNKIAVLDADGNLHIKGRLLEDL